MGSSVNGITRLWHKIDSFPAPVFKVYQICVLAKCLSLQLSLLSVRSRNDTAMGGLTFTPQPQKRIWLAWIFHALALCDVTTLNPPPPPVTRHHTSLSSPPLWSVTSFMDDPLVSMRFSFSHLTPKLVCNYP